MYSVEKVNGQLEHFSPSLIILDCGITMKLIDTVEDSREKYFNNT